MGKSFQKHLAKIRTRQVLILRPCFHDCAQGAELWLRLRRARQEMSGSGPSELVSAGVRGSPASPPPEML